MTPEQRAAIERAIGLLHRALAARMPVLREELIREALALLAPIATD